MYRKPFRPPLLKKARQDVSGDKDGEQSSASTGTGTGVQYPARKKAKLGDPSESTKTTSARRITPVSNAARRPLLSLKNTAAHTPPADQDIVKVTETLRNERDAGNVGVGEELYFSVLWRKFTTKKHKTFDGDGVLVLSGGYAVLQDLSGKNLGKSMWSKRLGPGDQLSIGGKEVEVDSVFSRKDYMAGRPFVKNSVVAATLASSSSYSRSPSTTTPAAPTIPPPKSLAASLPSKQFKCPLLTPSTVLPSNNSSRVPTPRHDPTGPNALVMPRLPPSSIPSGKRQVAVVVDPFLGQHLRPHQREGVTFLYEAAMGLKAAGCQGAILADEMGLGKTLQTIALLWTLMKQNPVYDPVSGLGTGRKPVVRKALVVCPVTLISNWEKEFRKWLGNERIGVLAVGEKTNVKDFTAARVYNVMIVGYERLQKITSDLKKADIDIVIADEGHRLKSERNKAAQAIRALKTQRRIILSGTPLQNDLQEFFTMVDFVNPGLLDTYSTFKRTFEEPIVKSRQPEATAKDIEKGKARGDELASITKMFVLRRTAEILSKYLPPKIEYVVFCRPTKGQLDVYRQILDSAAFTACLGNPQSSLQLITFLKKICNCPALLTKKSKDDGENGGCTFTSMFPTVKSSALRATGASSSGKMRVLDRMLVTLRQTTDEKIVLVSNYTSTLDLLQNLLNARGYTFLRLDGSTPAAKRQDLVDKFNRVDAETAFAFLLSAKSGGAGINLIGASRLVLFDLDWNPATDQQAMARIHRDGQRMEVKIYRMITTGCLDEKIYQRQLSKQGLADSVMDQKSSASTFSLAELRDLFTLDEDTECQTHDLLLCDCGGRRRGVAAGVEIGGPVTAECVQGDGNGDDGSEEEESLKAEILPGLMRASCVNMVTIEEEFRKSRPNLQRNKKEQLSRLMAYDHIAPSALPVGSRTPAGENDAIGDDDVPHVFLADEVLGKLMGIGRDEGEGEESGSGSGGEKERTRREGRRGDISFVLQRIN